MDSVFTVEQVELIRRLRQTGIRPEMIIQAYESLDRIEHEFKKHLKSEQQRDINHIMQHHHNLAAHVKRHLPPDDINSAYTPIAKRINPISQHSPLERTSSSSQSVSGSSVQNEEDQSPEAANPILLQHLNKQNLNVNGQTSLNLEQPPAAVSVVSPTVHHSAVQQAATVPNTVSSSMSIATLLQQQQQQRMATAAVNSSIAQQQQHFNAHQFRPHMTASMSNPNMLSNMLAATAPRLYGPRRTPPPLRPEVAEFTNLQDPTELEQFIKKGEDTCINEIKSFVSQLQLRQTTVAQMTGISQPYVSKFLNGNYRELSLRVRHLLFKWYLNCQKKPERLAQFVSEPVRSLPLLSSPPMMPSNGNSAPSNNNNNNHSHTNNNSSYDCTANSLQMLQRRERYVFRPIMIPIMERFFRDNPYPDLEKRMEIAAECNRALQMEKRGTPVLSKELVSPQIIANWFANKRKDMKRRQSDDTNGLVAGLHMGNLWGADSPSPLDLQTHGPLADPLANSVLATQYAQLLAQNLQNLASMGDLCNGSKANGHSIPNGGSSGAATPNGSSEGTENGKSTPTSGEEGDPVVGVEEPARFHSLQNELAAVSNNILALVNPYGEDESAKERKENEEKEKEMEEQDYGSEEAYEPEGNIRYANGNGNCNGESNHYFGQQNAVKCELVTSAE